MPDAIQQSLQGSPILFQWYSWGVILSGVLVFGATAWIFTDSRRRNRDSPVWESLAAVASVLTLPSLLARLHGGFAFEMRGSLAPLAFLSLLALLLAVTAVIAYGNNRQVGGSFHLALGLLASDLPPDSNGADRQGQHTGPAATVINDPVASITPIIAPTRLDAVQSRSEKEVLVMPSPRGFPQSSGPAPSHGTVILGVQQPRANGILVIASGSAANQILPLTAGVTRIGRNSATNDYSIDDEAISEQHLSIRFQDDSFIATDLDSSNGTKINGKRIDRSALETNDLIQIGKTKMFFVRLPSLDSVEDD